MLSDFQQLREIFEEYKDNHCDIEGQSTEELLKLFLQFLSPRRDFRAICARLALDFPRMLELTSLPPVELRDTYHLSKREACGLKTVFEIVRLLELSTMPKGKPLNNILDLYRYVKPLFFFIPYEQTLVLSLDHRYLPIDYEMATFYDPCRTIADDKWILQIARRNAAKAIVVVHNHPHVRTEKLRPSESDWNATEKIKRTFSLFHVKLANHLILAEDGCYAMCSKHRIPFFDPEIHPKKYEKFSKYYK